MFGEVACAGVNTKVMVTATQKNSSEDIRHQKPQRLHQAGSIHSSFVHLANQCIEFGGLNVE